MNALVVTLVLAQSAPDAQQLARARAAVAPFKKQLKEALTGAMKASPVSAIDVCATQAPALAKAASRDGVTVGRSAFQLRNPVNAPRPWLSEAMKALSTAASGSDATKAVPLPGGRLGYAEAIWVQAPCLVCHGAEVASPIADELRQRYPADAARGFREGDFRGVFWAEVDAPAAR
jgi:hypothetical protein